MEQRTIADVLHDVRPARVRRQAQPRQPFATELGCRFHALLWFVHDRREKMAAGCPQAIWPGASNVDTLCGHPEQ
ncbi:hypothetical protein ACTMU2_17360 [Cupriavidus basilensis]